jgi:hypothetical protein
LVADIDNDVFKGTVTVTQKQLKGKRKQITEAKWVINIKEINEDICVNCDGCDGTATALNWHIHESPITDFGADGNICAQAGNHWDPTFGCGIASQFAGVDGLCETIAGEIDGREIEQTCDRKADIAKCEMGDLNGKMGQVKIKKGRQQFSDNYISNLDNIKDFSIVFHCGALRVACGNLETVTN